MTTGRIEGQRLTAEQITKAEKNLDEERAKANHVQEADACAREILELLPTMWAERGFSQEQSVFAIAIVTIHLRATFPGGKQRFDEVAHEAHEYYAEKL